MIIALARLAQSSAMYALAACYLAAIAIAIVTLTHGLVALTS